MWKPKKLSLIIKHFFLEREGKPVCTSRPWLTFQQDAALLYFTAVLIIFADNLLFCCAVKNFKLKRCAFKVHIWSYKKKSSCSQTGLLIIDWLFHILLGSSLSGNRRKEKQKSGKKEEDGQRRRDLTEKNARSEGESAPFKASHLAFIWWIPHLLHVLVAVGSRSRIRWASSFHFLPTTESPFSFSSTQILKCSTSPKAVIVAPYVMLEKEGVRVRECRGNLGVKRAIETGLGCPAPVPPIHSNVYTLSSTINGSQRLGCLPSTGPHRPFLGPYGCLIEHATLLIELTAWSLGPFPCSSKGILSIWARRRDRARENRGAGSCQNCQENVPLAVDKAKLKMSAGGKQRSRSSWGQDCLEDTES